MTKMWRPKSENPRITQISVRLNDEDIKQLDVVASEYKTTRVEVIRKGIRKLFETIKK